MFGKDKRSSLFCHSVSEQENRFSVLEPAESYLILQNFARNILFWMWFKICIQDEGTTLANI